jgi:hypothetical protein
MLTLIATSACSKNDSASSGLVDGGAAAVDSDGGVGGGQGSGGFPPMRSAGGQSAGGGEATGGSPSACVPALARCGDNGDVCCSGALCIERDGSRRCVQTCVTATDCGSLCCADDATTGAKLCADQSDCPPLECSGVAGPCTQPGPSCCNGLTCVSSRAPEYSGCRKPCTTANGCESGCCVPYADGKSGFCAEAAACACAVLDGVCGGVHHCCDGLACATFDASGAFACKPECQTDADCQSGCCRPIEGTADSACLSADWCSH